MPRGKRARPVEWLMNQNVQVGAPNECWPWIGSLTIYDYGVMGRGKAGSVLAHRAAYELVHGPIPHGMFILHTCDNPPCCNPAHLRPGTHQENMADMMAKGRHRSGPNAPKVYSKKAVRGAWSERDIAACLEHWNQGLSADQIAKKIGRTRHAVLGKLFRLGYAECHRQAHHKNAPLYAICGIKAAGNGPDAQQARSAIAQLQGVGK